jgi:hypothetical protein
MLRLLIALCATFSATSSAAPFFLRDGDNVVFLGDSVTEMQLYTNAVELWTITRFPQWKMTFRNAGLGSDRSPGGDSRFKRDVMDKNKYYHDQGFRGLLVQPVAPDAFVLRTRLAEVAKLDDALRLAIQPQPHHVELIALP